MRSNLSLFRTELALITLVLGSVSVPSFAHHPNEGNLTLSVLLDEAEKNSIEIKEARSQYESASAGRRQTISAFLPQVSIDGGYQDIRLDGQQTNGTQIYGFATLNLYRGRKDSLQRRSAAQEENFQRIRAEKIKAKIEREVSKKFYELLYLQEGLNQKKQAIEANKNQKSLATKKNIAGFTSKADVLEFELREATLLSDMNFLMREEALTQRELARLVGRSDESVIRVRGHLERYNYTASGETLLKTALNERVDLKDAEKNLSISELSYQSLFSDYLPRVDLEGKYGKLANEERVYQQRDNYAVALKFSIPIFSGLDTVYGRDSKSKEIARNDLSTSRIRQEIRVQLENTLAKLRSIAERLDLEEKNIERSKQYYDITLAEYKRGVKNSPDVAGAAERLFDSQLRNLEFRKDYLITWLEVAESAGISGSELMRLTQGSEAK